MWLLALVLPLQGTAAAVFAAIGPLHGHRVASATPVLQDFRRWTPTPQREMHVVAALGHFHTVDTPQRHHHARGDASVVPTAVDVGDDDEAAGASAVAVLAPIPDVVDWLPAALASADASRPPWPPLTGFVLPLDRPPRHRG